MIPEYKCRRCGTVFDAGRIKAKLSENQDYAATTLLELGMEQKTTENIPVIPLLWMHHSPCLLVTKYATIHGTGIADLVGGRDER